MDNNAKNRKTENEILYPITIRFTANEHAAIAKYADANHISKAEVVRFVIANRMPNYLACIKYIDESQGEQIRQIVFKLLSTMAGIKLELKRIGVNFNQAVKLRNIEEKIKQTDFDVDILSGLLNEKEHLLKDNNMLNKKELNEIMSRYENATKEMRDLLYAIH